MPRRTRSRKLRPRTRRPLDLAELQREMGVRRRRPRTEGSEREFHAVAEPPAAATEETVDGPSQEAGDAPWADRSVWTPDRPAPDEGSLPDPPADAAAGEPGLGDGRPRRHRPLPRVRDLLSPSQVESLDQMRRRLAAMEAELRQYAAPSSGSGVEALLAELETLREPGLEERLRACGIDPPEMIGVPIPRIRQLAQRIGPHHQLALKLWKREHRESRLLAALLADPRRTDDALMEEWALALGDWEICDKTCEFLFIRTQLAFRKALAWSQRSETFVKRAGFVLMALLAAGRPETPNAAYEVFLPIIEKGAADSRYYVLKGASWALRQIGKRNQALHEQALRLAAELARRADGDARWVGRDALTELESREVCEQFQSQLRQAVR